MTFDKINFMIEPTKALNQDITNCLNQLALRAEELGEKNTAVVLHTLVAHRIMLVDSAMAVVAGKQAILLNDVIIALNKPKDSSL